MRRRIGYFFLFLLSSILLLGLTGANQKQVTVPEDNEFAEFEVEDEGVQSPVYEETVISPEGSPPASEDTVEEAETTGVLFRLLLLRKSI